MVSAAPSTVRTDVALPTGLVSLGRELPLGVARPRPTVLPLITSSTRLPVLDGLRGTAILLVIVYHLLTQLEAHPGAFRYAVIAGRLGWSGVDLFFVLSGFLIGGILLDAHTSPRYYPTFYTRRAFRILPIYGVLLFFYCVRSLLFRWMPGYSPNLAADEIPLL